jgi:hypothetical protein
MRWSWMSSGSERDIANVAMLRYTLNPTRIWPGRGANRPRPGTESGSSRHASQATSSRAARLPCQSGFSRSLLRLEEPMSSIAEKSLVAAGLRGDA